MLSVFSASSYKPHQKTVQDPFIEIWDKVEDKPIYAKLQENGTIDIAADKHWLTRKIVSFFSLESKSDLFAVNQKLKSLYDQIMEGQGEDFDNLKNEVHLAGAGKFKNLSKHLLVLDAAFKKANQESFILVGVRKVMNCFRELFHFSPLAKLDFSEIDTEAFIKKLEGEALQLTEEERASELSLEIIGDNIPQELATALSEENLKKLKYKLIEDITFQYGEGHVRIKELTDNDYKLSIWDSTNNLDTSSKYAVELTDKKLGVLTFKIKGFKQESSYTERVNMQNITNLEDY